ncbi:MAG: hypothetical protein LC131_07145 [Anaerolineae bacterium]|nr:hypothetical protein [Anaerolineae bacterium]
MTTGSYLVDEIGLANENLPAACDSCEWVGNAGETKDIDSTALDAGDPSPVGRCPECDSLAYLDRLQDRVIDHALQLFDCLSKLATATSNLNAAQHSGRNITADEWSDLYALTNQANALLTKVRGDHAAER